MKEQINMRHNLPLSLKIIRGAIGKDFVIKHYKYGVIKTKFPDMTRIVATMQQRKCRNLFKDAVSYACRVIGDAEAKRNWQKRLRKRNSVYNAAVKFYMLKDKRAKEAAMLEAKRLLRLATREMPAEIYEAGKIMQQIQSKLKSNTCQTTKSTQEIRIASG